MEEPIDFENIKHKTLEKQFQAYQRQHPKSQLKTLQDFAMNIEQNPRHYQGKTVQRAKSYAEKNQKAPKEEQKETETERPENIRLKYGVSFCIPSVHS
jgi:hypothetical protein